MEERRKGIAGSKVLVIGASSFIGSHLVRELINREARVTGTYWSKPSTGEQKIDLRPLDITDREAVYSLVSEIKPDYILNLSGRVKGARSLEEVLPTFEVNLRGSLNLMMALSKQPVKRVILLGSLEEGSDVDPLFVPPSPYGASKIAARQYAQMFHMLFHLPVVWARPFMVYGPNQKDEKKLVPYTILSLLNGNSPRFTSGSREADWIYVSDLVNGLIACMTAPGIEGECIQLGTGKLASVAEVVESIFETVSPGSKPSFGDKSDRKAEVIVTADVQTTFQQIGWEPEISLSEGIRKTVAWYQEQFKYDSI